ncbi:hypothetical protein TESG_00663 [Trichophyton tonsurans CBS 112818]|uniref:Large ribosomal subunit protein eL39 n=1 Tax=Trichophyton tonsurans (strain CBS 112818) TaxID=647933 RepID=F2RP51_TRIT1|nr:hypothetical protein TESG_00663 [Trichophyton tonsurans CBS 112818]
MLVEVGCSSLTKLSRSEVASRDLRNQPSEPSPLHTELLPFFQFLTIEKLHVATLKISKDATVHETPSRCLQKSFRTKQKLAKAQKQNRPIPQWIRLRTGNTIRYNAKRRHWRKTRLGI